MFTVAGKTHPIQYSAAMGCTYFESQFLRQTGMPQANQSLSTVGHDNAEKRYSWTSRQRITRRALIPKLMEVPCFLFTTSNLHLDKTFSLFIGEYTYRQRRSLQSHLVILRTVREGFASGSQRFPSLEHSFFAESFMRIGTADYRPLSYRIDANSFSAFNGTRTSIDRMFAENKLLASGSQQCQI